MSDHTHWQTAHAIVGAALRPDGEPLAAIGDLSIEEAVFVLEAMSFYTAVLTRQFATAIDRTPIELHEEVFGLILRGWELEDQSDG